MKRLLKICLLLWAGLLLSGCGSGNAPQNDAAAISAPISTLTPGLGSILVPPTLNPDLPRPTLAQPGQSGDTVELTLTNLSSWKVCYVFVTPPTADTWGKDWLGSDEEIDLDASRVFQVPADTYDVRAENCDYTPLNETFGLDLTQPYSWDVSDPQVSFDEEFDKDVAWGVLGQGTAGEVRSGAYYLSTSQAGSLALGLPSLSLRDMDITVEAMPTAPADVSQVAYGVMCRVQANGDGYLFLARGDGKYAIDKDSGGKRLALVDWTASDQIDAGSKLNVLEANCQGDELAWRLNGQTVYQVNDATFQQGNAALAALPLAAVPGEVQFDNFVVINPQ